MVARTKALIRELLYQHYEFADCVIEDVKWGNQGAIVDVCLNYVWSDAEGFGFDQVRHFYIKEGVMRANLEEALIKVIRFHYVQELHVHNWFPAELEILEPLSWGLSEVAAVRIAEDNLFLAKYRSLAREYHHITFKWEGDRRIDIVCAGMEVREEE
jgi:hypothetical protein